MGIKGQSRQKTILNAYLAVLAVLVPAGRRLAREKQQETDDPRLGLGVGAHREVAPTVGGVEKRQQRADISNPVTNTTASPKNKHMTISS